MGKAVIAALTNRGLTGRPTSPWLWLAFMETAAWIQGLRDYINGEYDKLVAEALKFTGSGHAELMHAAQAMRDELLYVFDCYVAVAMGQDDVSFARLQRALDMVCSSMEAS